LTLSPVFSDALTPAWRRVERDSGQLAVAGYVLDKDGNLLGDENLLAALGALSGATPTEIGTWLDSLDGMFGMIYQAPNWTFAAADAVRSYSVVWAKIAEGIAVDNDPRRLLRQLQLGPESIDPAQARAVSMSGYTIGPTTLYPAIKPIGPGNFLNVREGDATLHRYHRWQPWAVGQDDMATLESRLGAMHEKLIETLIASSNGRQILVPLSAGLDSRFIASGLKAAGYDNVRCFTYGQAGNREVATSREISRRLGYEWAFFPYTQATVRAAWQSDEFQEFWRFADRLDAAPFIQDFLSLSVLRTQGWLADDPIVVNGQSGDFTSGNHLPASMFDPRDDGVDMRRGRILDALINKHFRLWRSLLIGENRETVEQLLETEIAAVGGLPADPQCDHGLVEYCEFQDRQSKYVIAGQRTYDWFGLDWRLPLWERPSLDFWGAAPLEAKRRQVLYRAVLTDANWAGVWRDLPVNPDRVRPAWVVPLRLLAKALHAPLGQLRWRRFEKQYLEYWMAPLCHYAPWPWHRIAADRRGFNSPFAWYAATYLEQHGRNWDGSAQA
jgi:asparagine synthase (glutamine-hydrolysing)